ncbi:DUF2612 domain-containing structural protein [Aeromonas phage Gekk3-15]
MKPYSYKMTRPLDWQRNKAVAIPSLLESKESWYDQFHHNFWNNWHTDVFDLTTANSFGLLVWSFILDVPAQAFLLFPDDVFWAYGDERQNYYHIQNGAGTGDEKGGNFIGGTDSTILTPVEAKKALRMKYYSLITNGTIPQINAALLDVFGTHADGKANAWLADNGNMTVTYKHRDYWSPAFVSAVVQFDMLPKIAGIKTIIMAV